MISVNFRSVVCRDRRVDVILAGGTFDVNLTLYQPLYVLLLVAEGIKVRSWSVVCHDRQVDFNVNRVTF